MKDSECDEGDREGSQWTMAGVAEWGEVGRVWSPCSSGWWEAAGAGWATGDGVGQFAVRMSRVMASKIQEEAFAEWGVGEGRQKGEELMVSYGPRRSCSGLQAWGVCL